MKNLIIIEYKCMKKISSSHFLLLLIIVSFLFINGCGGLTGNVLSSAGATIGNIAECYVYVPARGVEIKAGFEKGAPPGYIPLQGARVTVVAQSKYALTNDQGYAQIKDVPAGTYSVTITKDGYRGITYSNVTVSDTSITTIGDSGTGVQTQTSSNPAIADLSSISGLEDSSLTITGYGFGSAHGVVTFYNNKTATVTSWSATQIVCTVSADAETGNIKVTVGGNSSNEISFIVPPSNNPVVTSLSSSSGKIATSVTIVGSGFGSTRGSSEVKFNGTSLAAGDYTTWSDTQITCKVPSGATTGAVVITVGGNDSNTDKNYTVIDYALRDTGPAGGLICYDKGSYSDGWRYLEAAPSDQGTEVEWGGEGTTTGATGTAIGTGNSNTTTIVGVLGAGSYAARICYDLELGGYSDWFLPSKDELNKMYTELKQHSVGDFADEWYWSSSEEDENFAWFQAFSNGFQNADLKGAPPPFYVRAIRDF